MNRMGRSAADLLAYHAALADTHRMRTSVDVLDNTGDTLSTIDQRVDDGQVDVSLTASPTRTATVYFQDPANELRLGFDRMIRVWLGVLVPDIGWVDCPVFTGPVRKLDWSDSVATVEAHGKEAYHDEPAFHPFTLRKGMRKTDAIRELLQRGGETHLDLADSDSRLPHSVSVVGTSDKGRRAARRRERARRTVDAQSSRWDKAQDIAESLDMQLFYDGSGVATLRRHSDNAVLTFRAGTGGLVMSSPQVSRSIDRVRNCVRVKGGFPKAVQRAATAAGKTAKESDRVRYSITAKHANALSPWTLGLDGEPLFLPDFVDNEHIRSKAEAHAIARRRLADGLRAEALTTFDSLPAPHLEEGDLVRVSTDAVVDVFRLRDFSIPLAHSGLMSVGYRKLVSRPSRRNVK